MRTKRLKVLIIKVGYSETLAAEFGGVKHLTSYGDVLRSTVLLNLFKDEHVTWLVDEKAYPILKNNSLIDRILIYNLTSVLQLQREHFDTVINLEKVPGLCALADTITAWRRYGFRLDVATGEPEAYDGSHVVLGICRDIAKKKDRKAYWQDGLFEIAGEEWKGEKYILGYKPKNSEQYDIGFNHQVGNKWPLKGWPREYWDKLGDLLKDKYSISWQQGLDNMEDYFEWVNTCRLFITNDSFGLHIAIALEKKIVSLFGPTHYSESYLYGLGEALYPKGFECHKFPCSVSQCVNFKDTCMSLLTPEMVAESVDKVFRGEHVRL